MRVGAYTVSFAGLRTAQTAEKDIFAAPLEISRGGKQIATMTAQRNLHLAQQQWQSEVAIRTNPVEDLYIVMTSFDRNGSAVLRAFVNPLTWWIWAGALVMLGGMIVIIAGSQQVTAAAPAPVAAKRPAVAAR
jgi:cytochrome c-type biogenesis protein CcmF